MKSIENILGFIVGKISNVFISLFVRFFMHRQYRGFTSATSNFNHMAESTPNLD